MRQNFVKKVSFIIQLVENIYLKTEKFQKSLARALYNFTAENSFELSMKKGDNIEIVKKIDQNWLYGQIHDRTGIFPSSYVEIIEDLTCDSSSTLPLPFSKP